MSNKYLMSALKKVVLGDFTTAKKAFLKQGITSQQIDDHFKLFKEARDRGKIKNTVLKNIDTWASRPWQEFFDFIDQLKVTYTKSDEKKEPWISTPQGAEKVAENSEWVVFKINTFKASKILGSKNWCTSRNEGDWDDYMGSEYKYSFYFALSKTRSYKIKNIEPLKVNYTDPLHKLVLLLTKSAVDWEYVTDANDDEVLNMNSLSLPSFSAIVKELN